MKQRKPLLKKAFALLMGLTALAGLSLSAAAADDGGTTECAAASSAKRGEVVTVTVSLNNCDPIQGLAITPVYDGDVFEFVPGSGEWKLQGALMTDFNEATGSGVCAFAVATNVSGEVFSFKLKVKADAAFGESVLSAEPVAKVGSTVIDCTAKETKLTVVCEHSFANTWNTDAGSHWKDCTVDGCDGKSGLAQHVYDNACDTTCNVCGYTRVITHSYAQNWSSDGTAHWHECSVCGDKKDTANHTGGSANCTQKALCDVCGTSYGSLTAHTYVEKAEAKYLKSDADCSHKAVYFKSCSVCGEKGNATFESGELNADRHLNTEIRDAVDATCTADGYTGDTYCKDCNVKVADGTVIPAGHDYGTEYVSDGDNHWKECKCGDVAEKATHTFGEWATVKEATKTEKGSRERACSVCGYKETEDIEALGAVADDNTNPPPTGENNALILWLTVLALSGAGITSTIILRRKRHTKGAR